MVAPSRSFRDRSIRSGRRQVRDGSWPQAVTVLTGLVFVLIGALGFLATGFDHFATANSAERLFFLTLNPLQNLLHLVLGLLGIAMSGRLSMARWYGLLLVAVFGAVFGFGLVAVDRPDLNVLNLNVADNWLHLGAALAGLAAALGPARRRTSG